MKSLWSGVSGLQAHQIAMDVEGHNISNVNTVGFKYSRANFADMMSQTMKIATSPQGDIGGKNDMQVGLGTNVVSTTKIFSQGSTKNTDKNTDMTIQGDGFFIVSADGGANYNYTRNGDFNLDRNGTLVDSNGFAVQGWKKNIVSNSEGCTSSADAGLVDSTQPIQSIKIEPGLKIPANTTSNIELKANLNSGESVKSKDCIYPTGSSDGLDYKKSAENLGGATDFSSLFNQNSKSVSLDSAKGTTPSQIAAGTGVSISHTVGTGSLATNVAAGATTIDFGTAVTDWAVGDQVIISNGTNKELVTITSITGAVATIDADPSTAGNQGLAHSYATATPTTMEVVKKRYFVFTDNAGGGSPAPTGYNAPTTTNKTANDTYFFKSPADLQNSLKHFAESISTGANVSMNAEQGMFRVDNSGGNKALNLSVKGWGGGSGNDFTDNPDSLGDPAFTSIFSAINGTIATPDVTSINMAELADANGSNFKLASATGNSTTEAIKNGQGITLTIGGTVRNFVYTDGNAVPATGNANPTGDIDGNSTNDTYFFKTTQDLANSLTHFLNQQEAGASATIVGGNKIQFNNPTGGGGAALNISISDLVGGNVGNPTFASTFTSLAGNIADGGASIQSKEIKSNNTIKDTNEIKTKVFVTDEDMGVMFDANGQALSLQSATTTVTGKVDGQGIRIKFGGKDSEGKDITREVTFRYTDGNTALVPPHPSATKVVNQGVGGANSFEVTRDTDGKITKDNPVYFKTVDDLRYLIQQIARDVDSDGKQDNKIDVTINKNGKIEMKHNDTDDKKNLSLTVAPIKDDNTTENVLFNQTMSSLTGTLEVGKVKTSQALNAATHATSIEVYDSLGSKHSLRFEFRKISANEWAWRGEVPKPGTLTGAGPEGNILRGGKISFNEDGSLKDVNPPTLTFTANNGSRADQIIQLDFGTLGGFDGITSLVKSSSTEGISQDGYPSGDLLDIRIDQTGTVMGSFSNGRSLALAQVALAKFTNNAGLTAEGSNLFRQTSNSGDPTIGTAGTGGRGSILASALEMSNVDLSRSLTELIVVQRGYQANSKTITTSDQMLQALLAIKK
jgi:flagellar hook-basal body protein